VLDANSRALVYVYARGTRDQAPRLHPWAPPSLALTGQPKKSPGPGDTETEALALPKDSTGFDTGCYFSGGAGCTTTAC
jgi:hypothetical protein